MRAQLNIVSTLRIATVLCVCFVLGFVAVSDALAQRPVRMFDPFYKGETAKRTFYDTYAVTGEISYRPPGLLTTDDVSSSGTVSGIGSDPLGLNLRFDYRLSNQLDLGFYIDATGGGAGRALDLSWVVLKYFKRLEGTDYSIRLAVDPSADGRSGFPQTDLAFLYTSLLSPTLSTHFGLGVRRVQIGLQEFVQVSPPAPGDDASPTPSTPATDIVRTRAMGWEVHMTTSYNILFDPAGSNLFVAILGQGGNYDLVEWIADETSERTTTAYRGGVMWFRSGLEIERPGYQFAPYLALPVKHWEPDGDWPRPRAHVGVRLMLR